MNQLRQLMLEELRRGFIHRPGFVALFNRVEHLHKGWLAESRFRPGFAEKAHSDSGISLLRRLLNGPGAGLDTLNTRLARSHSPERAGTFGTRNL